LLATNKPFFLAAVMSRPNSPIPTHLQNPLGALAPVDKTRTVTVSSFGTGQFLTLAEALLTNATYIEIVGNIHIEPSLELYRPSHLPGCTIIKDPLQTHSFISMGGFIPSAL
jgi:hypothetical protein